MEPKECFEALIARVGKAQIPISFKAVLEVKLQYFIAQTQLELEKRDSPVELKKNWIEFRNIVRGLEIFAAEEANENLWRVVKCFVYEEEPASLIVPRRDPPKPKAVSKFVNYTPEEFFSYLSKELESQKPISNEEYIYALMGVRYLESEAGKPIVKRNLQRVKSVWKGIEPILKKIGVLDEFKNEHKLLTSVHLFTERTI